MIETDEAVQVSAKPTHTELERAIASVPGVEEAHVTRLPDTGRSRLRIRLANGEDAPTVSWAISATLRERFGIVLDPGAIRPKLSVSETPTTPGESADEVSDSGEPSDPTPLVVSWSAPRSEAVDDRPAPAAEPRQVLGHSEEADVAPSDAADAIAAADQNGDAADDPMEGKVVVIGDRVELNEAARAVLAESLEMASPQQPLESTTGPVAEGPRVPGPSEDQPDEASPEAATGLEDEAEPRPGVDPDSSALEAEGEARPGEEPASGGSEGEEFTLTAVASAQDPEPPAGPATTHRRLWSAGEAPEEVDPLRRGQETARAAIRHLDTQIDVSDVRVTATLAHGGRSVTGEASSVPTRKGILRAVAEATVSALRQLTGDRLVVGVDSVVASVAGEPPMATVLVGIVTDAGEQTLLGSSLVRQDPERAVMRATLDALNRRIEPWLEFDLAG